MKKMILKTALLAAATLALPATARAQPTASVVWTLNNFTFAGGATATGSFEWAPDTDQILSWDILMSSNFYAGNDSKNSPLRYSNVLSYNSVQNIGGYLRFSGLGVGNWDTFSFGFAVVPTELDVQSDRVNLAVTTAQYGQTWNFIECNSGCSYQRYSNDNQSAYLSSQLTAGAPGSGSDSSVDPITTVPEPTTVSLMAIGMLMLGAAARRTRRA